MEEEKAQDAQQSPQFPMFKVDLNPQGLICSLFVGPFTTITNVVPPDIMSQASIEWLKKNPDLARQFVDWWKNEMQAARDKLHIVGKMPSIEDIQRSKN